MKDFKPNDIRIEYYKSSGPGGQRKNKKETAVRITHLTTGIVSISANERSQMRNKEIALKRLREKLERFYKRKKKRIPTKKPAGLKEIILQAKKRRGEIKQLRKVVKTKDYE